MTRREALDVISRIRLNGGNVEAQHDFYGDEYSLTCAMTIWVKDRGGDPNAGSVKIGTTFPVCITKYVTEHDLLQQIQQAWTALWMHESLETFIYDDKLVFNPHCPDSLKARCGTFMLDDSCQVVEIRPRAARGDPRVMTPNDEMAPYIPDFYPGPRSMSRQ